VSAPPALAPVFSTALFQSDGIRKLVGAFRLKHIDNFRPEISLSFLIRVSGPLDD
jgi:hypothetical protein